MSNAYIHLDELDTLTEYISRMEDWKERTKAIYDEMRHFHMALEYDQKWYGTSYSVFQEDYIEQPYISGFHPLNEKFEEAQAYLKDLRAKAEELGIR